MKKSLKITIGAAALCGVLALSVWGYSITSTTTSASFTNQTVAVAPNMHEVTVISQICAGDTIDLTATFGVSTPAGSTTFPKTVTFDAVTTAKPGANNVGVSGMPRTHVFTSAATSFNDPVTLTVPSDIGAYTVQIKDTSGTGGGHGITSGPPLVINFTVSDCAPVCTELTTVLTVPDICVQLHQTTPVDLTATLTDQNDAAVANQTVHFSVDGNPVGDATTNGSGVATISGFDVSGLSVGDHSVTATFDGIDCVNGVKFDATNGSGNLGVTYGAITFQQPINADGSSIFKGGTIPVKIVVHDGTGAIVSDAVANVFFQFGFATVIGDTSEAVSTSAPSNSNLMRWDPVAMQYVYNWDITGASVANGTYTIWIDLGEGKCGTPHNVSLSIQKAGKGIKK
jgi:Bacterial Ig-like domain (group 1).